MNIIECISRTDALRPNGFSKEEKIAWLSELDGRVKREIIDECEDGDKITFSGYDENTPNDTELLIPAPYDDIYIKWLCSQIDYYNNEYQKYNNSAYAFNSLFSVFAKRYSSEHAAKRKSTRFIF